MKKITSLLLIIIIGKILAEYKTKAYHDNLTKVDNFRIEKLVDEATFDTIAVPDVKVEEIYIGNKNLEKSLPVDSIIKTVSGYRIQIFKSESLVEAKVKEKLLKDIYEDKKELILIYDAPLYKIRLGKYRTKNEAENDVREMKKLGFHNSIIVPDKLKIKVGIND